MRRVPPHVSQQIACEGEQRVFWSVRHSLRKADAEGQLLNGEFDSREAGFDLTQNFACAWWLGGTHQERQTELQDTCLILPESGSDPQSFANDSLQIEDVARKFCDGGDHVDSRTARLAVNAAVYPAVKNAQTQRDKWLTQDQTGHSQVPQREELASAQEAAGPPFIPDAWRQSVSDCNSGPYAGWHRARHGPSLVVQNALLRAVSRRWRPNDANNAAKRSHFT